VSFFGLFWLVLFLLLISTNKKYLFLIYKNTIKIKYIQTNKINAHTHTHIFKKKNKRKEKKK